MASFSSFSGIFKTARSEAKTLASDHYPELEQILIDRPPPNSHQASGVDGLCALCNAEPATKEISGTTVGDRCAEHLMGVPGAGTPPPDFGQSVYGSQHTAGIMDWLDRKLAPYATAPDRRWSFDWCRYRKDSHCYYPSNLDAQATDQTGHAVWVPQDRGQCPRYTWEDQETCPIGAPGPNAGGQAAFGSRFGSLDEQDPSFHFHFVASWADVRAKAKRIRAEGKVRIIGAPNEKNPYITAEVQGDNNTYQTTILRTIGGKSVAGWECTCAWAHYAWGRSGRWKKFEGRQCSHALATIYQAQSEEMFGGKIKEMGRRPIGMEEPYFYKPPAQKDWRVGHKLTSFSEERPISMEAEARLEAGESPNEVLGYLRSMGAPWPEYILSEAIHKPFVARDPADELHTVVSIEGEHAVTDIGERIPVEHLSHPEFDWHSGLEPNSDLHMKSAKVMEDPSPHLGKDGEPHNGVMVALVPPEHVRQKLAVEGGEAPEDMHVTVGYLGSKDGVDADALHRAVGSFAKEAGPLSGKVSGFGNFEVDPERNDGFSHCHVGLVDIPGIANFREKLGEHLGREGLHINDEHGLQPHLSVAYGHEPMEYGSMPETTDRFDLPHVTVSHGSKWTHYPLEGSQPTEESTQKAAMLRWGAPANPAGELLHPHWQSPEAPTGRSKGRADDPNATKFSTYKPDFKEKISKQFHDNVPSELGVNTHRDLVENIKGMYREAKSTNPGSVKAGMKWYGDAHNFAKGLAAQHDDGNLRKSIGMTAALSPQCHWEENKTQAEYFHKHLSAHPDSEEGRFNISPEHAQAAMDKQAEQASVVKGHREVQKLTPGKRFADMSPEEAAHSLKAQAQYTHKLQVPGRLKNDGEPWSATFANGTGSIAKAVRIHRGEDPDDVLQGHKVRSFFNNIADPTNKKKRDDVTIDTHAVSLATGAKFGASAPAIKTMFANGANKEQNVTGTYGYIADAYRQAHKDLVSSGEMPKSSAPHHLQAVTWTHWRDINDEPGPLKEANKGRFADYSGTNAKRQKAFKQQQTQKRSPHQNPMAASLHWAVDNNAASPDDPGEPLDPSNYDEDAIDPDFDPDLADEAEQAEWDAEPEEKARLQDEADESDEMARRRDNITQLPKTSMLRWALKGHSLDIVRPGRGVIFGTCSCGESYKADDNRLQPMAFRPDEEPKIREKHQRHVYQVKKQKTSAVQGDAISEDVDPDTDDEMDDASAVQKDYADQAEAAQDDWYFNQPKDSKPFADNSANVPTYMSALPHGAMKHWADVHSTCRHCQRSITRQSDGSWINPDATGDDSIWRETCEDNHESFAAEHEPHIGGDRPEKRHKQYQPDTEIPLHHLNMKRWAAEAAEEMLHDEPEGALPSTDGGAPSELWDQQHSTTAADPISAGPAGFGAPLDPGYQHEDMGYPEADEAVLRPSGGPGAGSSMNKLEDQFTSLDATGSLDPGADSRAWLLSGGSPRNAGGDQGIRDSDIAAMARQFLATGELPEGPGGQTKVAAKTFTPAEQQELIQEGSDGTRASNLDRLQLEGTHYQTGDEEDDLEGLFG